MRKLLLLAGAAALASAGPALAKPGGGGGHAYGHANASHPTSVKTAHVANPHKRSWTTACPRGLVWRGPVCVPPGQRTKVLAVGTRVPGGWAYTPWGMVPADVRTHYDLDPHYRYIYRDKLIYVVDPRTHMISSVISATL
jgi:hypothetical protein